MTVCEQMVLPEQIADIVIRQVTHDADGSQIRGKVPVFVSSIEDDGEDAESCHNQMLMPRLSALVDDDVHNQNSRQIP